MKDVEFNFQFPRGENGITVAVGQVDAITSENMQGHFKILNMPDLLTDKTPLVKRPNEDGGHLLNVTAVAVAVAYIDDDMPDRTLSSTSRSNVKQTIYIYCRLSIFEH